MKRLIVCSALALSVAPLCQAQPQTPAPIVPAPQAPNQIQVMPISKMVAMWAETAGVQVLCGDGLSLKTGLFIPQLGLPKIMAFEARLNNLQRAGVLHWDKMGAVYLVIAPSETKIAVPTQPFDFVIPRLEPTQPRGDKSFEFNGRRIYEIPLHSTNKPTNQRTNERTTQHPK